MDEDYVWVHNVSEYVQKAGYTPIATSISFRSLQRKGFVEICKEEGSYNTNKCRLTQAGSDWVLENQDKVKLRKDEKVNPKPKVYELPDDDDDNELPF